MRNFVNICGRLTHDIELRFTPSGMSVTEFSVAINEGKDKDGNERPATFVNVEAWGKTAEAIEKFFKKGRPIEVYGRLKVDSWEDKTSGEKRRKMLVVANSFEFPLTEKSGGNSENEGEEEAPKPAAKTKAKGKTGSRRTTAASSNGAEEVDGEIPF